MKIELRLAASAALSLITAGALFATAASDKVALGSVRTFQATHNFFGTNGQLRGNFNWDQTAHNLHLETFQQVLGTMHLGILRLPTGTGANYWDWKAGTDLPYMDIVSGGNAFPSDLGELQGNLSYASNDETNTEFGSARTQPLFLMNLLTNPLNNGLDQSGGPPATGTGTAGAYQLDTTNGILATAWAGTKDDLTGKFYLPLIELGNEFYLPDGGTGTDNTNDYINVYTDGTNNSAGATYGTCVNAWISNIQGQEHTGSPYLCAAVAAEYDTDGAARRSDWNQGPNGMGAGGANGTGGLFKTLSTGADAVTIHLYINPNLVTTGSPTTPLTTSEIKNLLAVPQAGYEAMTDHNFSGTQGSQTIPSSFPVWITEYNLKRFQTTAECDTWAHGLCLAAMALKWMEISQVEMMVHHDVVGAGVEADIFQDTNGLAEVGPWATNGSLTPPATTLFGLTATGLVSRIINTAALGQQEIQEMTFSSPPPNITPPNNLVASYAVLQGWKFFDGGIGNKGVVLNLGASTANVDLSSFMSAGKYMQVSTTDPSWYVIDGTRLKAVSVTTAGVASNQTLTANATAASSGAIPENVDPITDRTNFPLPPYSITFLTW